MNEAAGPPEACDWCGRPGRAIPFDSRRVGGAPAYRDPSLCPVCELLHDADSGDIGDGYAGLFPDLDSRLEAFEERLAEAWRAKVLDGRRPPQGPDEGPPGRSGSWSRRVGG